jgi:hypothetical protein
MWKMSRNSGKVDSSKESKEESMIAIRIPKSQRGKAWRAMIEIGPITLIAKDPIYEVLPVHLDMLKARGFSYEVVDSISSRQENRRRAASN